MTATYSVADLTTSPKDQVRFLCQDTDVVSPGAVRLQDEEINFILSLQTNIFLAAAQCADEIATYWARITNTWIGPLKIERAQMVTYYQQVADRLRRTAARWCNASPVFYPADQIDYQDTNCGNGGPQHIFKIGQDDYPGLDIFWPPADLPPLTSYP